MAWKIFARGRGYFKRKTHVAAIPVKMVVLVLCIFIQISAAAQSTTDSIEDIQIHSRTEKSVLNSLGESLRRSKSHPDGPHFLPYFDNTTERNVTTQLSKPAYLHCRIRQLGDRVVSWVRQRDLHILTVGRFSYSSDARYTPIHREDTDDWTLEIKYAQKTDAGIYECQVSSEPKMSLSIQLNVVVAKAIIPEGPSLYIKSGSPVNLTCIVSDYAEPPAFVFWYRNEDAIDQHDPRVRLTQADQGQTTVSRLQIAAADPHDAGNYTCMPTYADPVNIVLHVLEGEKPAAMQHDRSNAGIRLSASVLPLMYLLILL